MQKSRVIFYILFTIYLHPSLFLKHKPAVLHYLTQKMSRFIKINSSSDSKRINISRHGNERVKTNYFYFKNPLLNYSLDIGFTVTHYRKHYSQNHKHTMAIYFYLAQNVKNLEHEERFITTGLQSNLLLNKTSNPQFAYIRSYKILTLLLTSFSFGRMSNPKPSACPRVLFPPFMQLPKARTKPRICITPGPFFNVCKTG